MIRNLFSRFLIGVFLFMMASCSTDKKEFYIPAEIVAQDTMIQLFADLHTIEAKITQSGITDSVTKSAIPSYYKFLLNKYSLDTTRFKKSFNFYMQHPHQMSAIYTSVLDELSKRQAESQK